MLAEVQVSRKEPKPPKVYSLEDVAEILDVSTRTVRRRIDEGELKAFRVGNRLRILHSDLIAYIESQRTN